MNTPIGLTIEKVTEATGLTRARIYEAAEAAQLGSPAHFIYLNSRVVYTPAGLCQLVEGLHRLGETVAAKALATQLPAQQALLAKGAAEVPAPAPETRRDWMADYERKQEDAA